MTTPSTLATPYDTDEERGSQTSLQEALLPSSSGNSTSNISWGLKLIFFVSGSLVAGASQAVLSQALWSNKVLYKSTPAIVFFSLQWSFWTCVAIFGCLWALLKLRRYFQQPPSMDGDDDAFIVELEVLHVVGALSAVSVTWLLADVWQVQNSFLTEHRAVVTASCCAAYGVFLVWIWFQSSSSSTSAVSEDVQLARTYQMVASLLGLVVGACTQLLLAVLLWDDRMQYPIIKNALGFSLVWSCCTVFFMSASFSLLSRFTLTSNHVDQQQHEQQRLQLRMEAAYVNCTLIGICLAWILLDLFLDTVEEILPSAFLLCISLVAFRIVLYCFPEDDCLIVRDNEEQVTSPVLVE
jgi:hypothetical protein